jgi:2-oxoglutarate ferredoxin oxidoreductase subunit alpha
LEGMSVGHLQLRCLMPFPQEAVKQRIERAKRVVVVDQNFTGQLTGLIHRELGYHVKTETLTKYDGNPYTVGEIVSFVKG